MTVQHVVLFRFPAALTVDEEAEMRLIIGTWVDQIATMSKLRFGTDIAAAGDRARGYHYLLLMEFDSVETYLAYREHEAHLALSRFIKSRSCEVLAFDYELNPSTMVMTE